MKKLLFDLYHGNFKAFEPPFASNAKQSDAFSQVEELEDKLRRVLPEEHQPLLRDLSNAYLNLMDVCCEDDFAFGYSIGVRMLLAAWPDTDAAAE